MKARSSPFVTGIALWSGMLLCTATGFAQTPYVRFPAPEKSVADIRSEAFRQKEKDALGLWKEGKRGEAKVMMYRHASDLAPADAAAAKVRLGYMNIADNNHAEAERLLEVVADMPSGVNDAAKAEAAERLAYLAMRDNRYDLCRARFQRLVSGEYEITNEKAADICHRLGLLERRLGNYQAGVPYLEIEAANAANPHQRAHAKTELAGLWLDMGNGDGKPQLPVEQREQARERARAYCQEVLAEVGSEPGKIVPLDREMIAQLMYFETFHFGGDDETAWSLCDAFLKRWGTDTGQYENNNSKIYLNTARTWYVLISYKTGRYEECLTQAEELAVNPPPISERFRNFDAHMYACVCGHLSCRALDRPGDATRFEILGKNKNPDRFDVLVASLTGQLETYFAERRAKMKELGLPYLRSAKDTP